jgi:hypothetical protein
MAPNEMEACHECGLPMSACSALALYRYAIQAFEQGRVEVAKEYAASARLHYDRYLEHYRNVENEVASEP